MQGTMDTTPGSRSRLLREAVDRARMRRQKPTSHLTIEQLAELRDALLRRREELVADMLELDTEWHSLRGDSEHSDEFECSGESQQAEMLAGLLQGGWEQLREIRAALTRMDNGTYGLCLGTGAPIHYERLRARPWARYCIAYARALERAGPQREAG